MLLTKSIHDLKIGSCYAISVRRIIWSVFLHETINSERYERLNATILIPTDWERNLMGTFYVG
jgi:hypothetical protein